jgi:hypothetical protein
MKTEDPDEAWRGNWADRVLDRVRSVGFPTFEAFLTAHPNASYSELADLLGSEDIAAVQLEHMHTALAVTPFARSVVMRDSLSRYLSRESQVIGALSNWIVMWQQEPWLRNVFTNLSRLAPMGWRPEGPSDPVIVQALKQAEQDV